MYELCSVYEYLSRTNVYIVRNAFLAAHWCAAAAPRSTSRRDERERRAGAAARRCTETAYESRDIGIRP